MLFSVSPSKSAIFFPSLRPCASVANPAFLRANRLLPNQSNNLPSQPNHAVVN